MEKLRTFQGHTKNNFFKVQGLLKDMMFFQGLFKARANRVEELFSPTFVVSLLLCPAQVTIKPLDQFTWTQPCILTYTNSMTWLNGQFEEIIVTAYH